MVVCSVNCVNLHCRRIGLRVFFVFMKLEKRSNHRDSQVSKQLFMLEKEEREKKEKKLPHQPTFHSKWTQRDLS